MDGVRADYGSALFPETATRTQDAPDHACVVLARRPLGRKGPASRQRPIPLDRRSQPGRDVLCAGMYRACSTWQYEVVGHLVERHLKGRRLGYVCGESYARLRRTDGVSGRAGSGPKRVLKSHEGARSFARALDSGQAIAVYSYRDLRDVVFSLIHKRGTSFRSLLREGMIHRLLANDRFWRTRPRVLMQRYEDLVADPVTGVVQLARHLGLGVARREAAEIAEAYSLASNRSRIEALRRRLLRAGIDLNDPANLQICDPTTLLHWNHLRPGHPVSWRTEATAEQRGILRRICDPWLLENGYEATDVDDRTASGPGVPEGDGDEPPCERDLMIGRIAYVLRRAAGRYPRASAKLKGLLGGSGRNPGVVIAWPGEPYPDAAWPVP
jgi:hypothetical protein